MAQNSGGVEDSMIYETNSLISRANKLRRNRIPDSIAVYYPPRPGGKRFITGRIGNNNVDVNCSGKGSKFEVVVNEGSPANPGTYWDYNGTVTPKGGKPFPIRTPGMGRGTGPRFQVRVVSSIMEVPIWVEGEVLPASPRHAEDAEALEGI